MDGVWQMIKVKLFLGRLDELLECIQVRCWSSWHAFVRLIAPLGEQRTLPDPRRGRAVLKSLHRNRCHVFQLRWRHFGKLTEHKKNPQSRHCKCPHFPLNWQQMVEKSTQRSFMNCQWWEMKTSLLLQKHHASACTYHILKSHPVPLGHVTFQNATVNDSLAHGRSPEGEMNPKHFTILPAILAQLICMSNYCHLSPSSDGSPIMCTWYYYLFFPRHTLVMLLQDCLLTPDMHHNMQNRKLKPE